MSSWFAGALLQGIGAGGVAYGKGMAEEAAQQRRDEEQRRREEAQIARDRERERAADEREQTRLAARTSAAGGSGGGGGSAGGRMSPAQVDEAMLNARPEEAAVRSGSWFDKTREVELAGPPEQLQGPGDAGMNPAGSYKETYREDGWEKLKAQKVKEFDEARLAMGMGSANYKEYTAGRLNEQQRDQLERFETGDPRAGEAAALGKKGELYGANQEITYNQVTGASKTTAVGEADIRAKDAQAGASRSLAQKRDRDTDTPGARGDGTDSMTLKQVESERKRLKDLVSQSAAAVKTATGSNRKEREASYDEARRSYEDFNRRVSGAEPEPTTADEAAQRALTLPRGSAERQKMLDLAGKLDKDVTAPPPKPGFFDRMLGNGTPPAPGASQPAQASGGMPKISSAAERDKLPSGTRYMAPNGQIMIKR